jgi:hypothetical protein
MSDSLQVYLQIDQTCQCLDPLLDLRLTAASDRRSLPGSLQETLYRVRLGRRMI